MNERHYIVDRDRPVTDVGVRFLPSPEEPALCILNRRAPRPALTKHNNSRHDYNAGPVCGLVGNIQQIKQTQTDLCDCINLLVEVLDSPL